MKRLNHSFAIYVFYVISVWSFSLEAAESCFKIIGALDIGSGATKGLVARVNTCEKRIVDILLDEKVAIAFGQAREVNPENSIPSAFVESAGQKMVELIKKMKEKGANDIRVVATAAFRAAQNGAQVAEQLSYITQLKVEVISQEREAQLGALSAISKIKNSNKDQRQVVVWDIGGGSMQMWMKPKTGEPHLFLGDLAAVTFKNQVIQQILGKDQTTILSPNPLGDSYKKAIEYSKAHALAKVPPVFFKNSQKKMRWIGVGGVLGISVQNQANPQKNMVSSAQIELALKKRSKLSDADLVGDYKTTDITNLALVLGYMRALKIHQIETVEASLAQGLLVE